VAISDVTPAATFWGFATFIIIAGVFIVGQFFILKMIKAKNNEGKYHHPNIDRMHKTVTITQYVIAVIMVFVVLQMLAVSHYYTGLLTVAVTVSYGLAVMLP